MPKERRDPRFTYPDEMDAVTTERIVERAKDATFGSLAILIDDSNPGAPALILIFGDGVSVAHALSRDACIETARQLLDAANVDAHVHDPQSDNAGKVG